VYCNRTFVVGFDHINRNPPVLIRTPKLTRFEPAQYWGGGPPGNSVVLNPSFFSPGKEPPYLRTLPTYPTYVPYLRTLPTYPTYVPYLRTLPTYPTYVPYLRTLPMYPTYVPYLPTKTYLGTYLVSISCHRTMVVGFDHINRNLPVLIRTPKLTRFEPA
jgi:hypothetical protein